MEAAAIAVMAAAGAAAAAGEAEAEAEVARRARLEPQSPRTLNKRQSGRSALRRDSVSGAASPDTRSASAPLPHPLRETLSRALRIEA